jgi:mannose/fructose-specific phosphotransferase system component IIA
MAYDATKSKFAPAAGIVSLTDNSGGTPSNTIPDVPAAYAEATFANIVASLTAKINALIDALEAAGITVTV